MPWIKITESEDRYVWLRTESIVGLAHPEQDITGTQILLLSGKTVSVAEDRERLLHRIKEAEGSAPRDRRGGFPAGWGSRLVLVPPLLVGPEPGAEGPPRRAGLVGH